MVLEDVILENNILLKKGSVLMAPTLVHHSNTSTWGEDAKDFNYMRFVRKPGQKGLNRTAFRGFGGGHGLCPGRNFASTEMMAFVALMVLKFDITPVAGAWVEPPPRNSMMPPATPVLDHDIQDKIKPRGKGKASNIFSRSDRLLGMVSEDVEAYELRYHDANPWDS